MSLERAIASLWFRIPMYFVMLCIGIALSRCYYADLYQLIHGQSAARNDIFASAIAVFLLTLPAITFNWIIKNIDVKKQFDNAAQQHAETLFSNSLQLLFKDNDSVANSVGLKELIKLRQSKTIEATRIDLITSSGLEIRGAKLQCANLAGANLEMVNFEKTDNTVASLDGASLDGANLEMANLAGASIISAGLAGTKLLYARLKGASLGLTNLEGANLGSANLESADLEYTDLGGANLRAANLAGASLAEANLAGADLERADFKVANLEGADLEGANLCKAKNLSCEQLRRAKNWEKAYRSGSLACGAPIPVLPSEDAE